MTEEQKALLESFPKKDRGMYGDYLDDEENKGDDEVPDLVPVEDDFVEAAALKAKLKQKAMKERRKQREADDDDEESKQKRVRFLNDEA